MILQPYEFIDKNSNNEKEPKNTANTELYNKLSATETNNFRNKINEIVVECNNNFNAPYNVFKFVQKGFGNTGSQTPPEANDVYCGHLDDGSQYCPVAYYRGSGTLNTHLSFKIPFTVGYEELTF